MQQIPSYLHRSRQQQQKEKSRLGYIKEEVKRLKIYAKCCNKSMPHGDACIPARATTTQRTGPGEQRPTTP
jgi:hypothetical protein